jgi:hypothetical protein
MHGKRLRSLLSVAHDFLLLSDANEPGTRCDSKRLGRCFSGTQPTAEKTWPSTQHAKVARIEALRI